MRRAKKLGAGVGGKLGKTNIGGGVGQGMVTGPAGKLGAGVGAGIAKPPKPSGTPIDISGRPDGSMGSGSGSGTPPVGTVLGGDPGLMASQDAALRQQQLAAANALYQQQGLQSTFGFDAQGGVDPDNPYGKAALALENYRRGARATQNSYAGRGLLYSSANTEAQSDVARNYSIGADQLLKQYGAAQQGVLSDYLGAVTDGGLDVSDATYQALLNKLKGS